MGKALTNLRVDFNSFAYSWVDNLVDAFIFLGSQSVFQRIHLQTDRGVLNVILGIVFLHLTTLLFSAVSYDVCFDLYGLPLFSPFCFLLDALLFSLFFTFFFEIFTSVPDFLGKDRD